ncbi:hypothetical protein AALK14_01010 [Butyricimonas hominis]|uniref:hypothetical protein n=1 Tax=Butyricimonas TaxID=574697 RepID=UPI0035137A2E
MKKLILLLGICFCVAGVYAQKLETQSLDETGDSFEVRIKHFNKLFGETFTPEKVAPLVQEKEKVAQRSAWREKCVRKMLTDQLKQILKQVAATEGGGLWVTFYIDKTGKVLTVKFMVSAGVYVKLSAKMQKELYNMAMSEKLDPSGYNFDETRTYAVDGFDLMKRAVEEDKK